MGPSARYSCEPDKKKNLMMVPIAIRNLLVRWWLFALSTSPLLGSLLSFLAPYGWLTVSDYRATQTVYAPGFSEAAFQSIKKGDSVSLVQQSLGKPLQTLASRKPEVVFHFHEARIEAIYEKETDSIVRVFDPNQYLTEEKKKEIKTVDDLLRIMGKYDSITFTPTYSGDPQKVAWKYSQPAAGFYNYYDRVVLIDTTTQSVAGTHALWFRR